MDHYVLRLKMQFLLQPVVTVTQMHIIYHTANILGVFRRLSWQLCQEFINHLRYIFLATQKSFSSI